MTTALYRRYRPETFDEVIGEEHVTDPLKAALRAGRVTHAYLFSGPRGCGKTTSARIFARCLNCEQGPTDTPCGVCPSCTELARGGTGSLDVVEIDAASHNGVDDARELRERAVFAPVRDRYKIFILDEAHMVTPQGFNALLKLVEEPPEHVKFVFATTEPDKVISTIRSRTHHYPFRLVPPGTLTAYLEKLCVEEGVTVGPGVLPMVVRAGAGSVRDSLSVLDQLIAGATDGCLDHDNAAALLGFTSASLLDDAVESLIGHDGAAIFRVVDQMVQSGHDPRRFVEDLLQRLRDLVILAIAGDAGEAALASTPQDQLERMRSQAQRLGPATASRAADLTNAALSEMSGATSPRLQVELLCARLLLPAADADGGIGARLERLERGGAAPVSPAVHAPAATPPAAPIPRSEPPSAPPASQQPAAPNGAAGRDRPPMNAARRAASSLGQRPARPTVRAAQGAAPAPAGAAPAAPALPPAPTAPPAAPARAVAPPPEPAAAPEVDTALVRRRWGEVLETLGRIRRTSWALVARSATVGEVRGGTMQLHFETEGLANAFRSGRHDENVATALSQTLGITVRVLGVSEGAVPRPEIDSTPGPHDFAAPPAAVAYPPEPPEEDAPSPDDANLEGSGQTGVPVIQRILGGRIVDEGGAP